MPPKALAKRRIALPPAQVSISLAALEEAIGGRAALVAALSHAPKSRDLAYVLGLIGDPFEAKTDLATLCAQGGITAGELIDAYKAGEINRAQAVATSKVGAKLAEVAEDTMRLSLTHAVVCGVCRGVGQLTPEPSKQQPNPSPVPCEQCGGSGQDVVGGDLEHKKLALEMGKLLQKGGGVNLQVHQQVGVQVGSAGGALERLQAATDQILYGDHSPSPLDAEVVDSEPMTDPDAPVEEGDWREEAHE